MQALLFLIRNHVSEIILGVVKPEWIMILSGILFLDNLWNHHVLLLRAENKSFLYIFYSLGNVILTMAFNILFVIICNLVIDGVLISNLMTSVFIFLTSLALVIKTLILLHIK